MPSIKNPHDSYFKSTMSNIKVARDFFDLHLPNEFRQAVDLKTLKLAKASYIDKELRELISDILYSVTIKGEEGYLYLLVEHQSKADRMMPFRILEYTCRIMRQDISNGKKSLPVVIPLVLYNGKIKYPYDHDIFSLFSNKQQVELAKKTLCKPFNLLDLNEFSDEELMSENWSNIMLVLMKHIYSRDLLNVLELLKEQLKFIYENKGKNYIFTSMKYVFSAGDIDELENLSDILNGINSEMGGDVMSLAERIFTQGIEEGISQGISQGLSQGLSKGHSQGLSKGITQGIQKTAKNMLQEGIAIDVVSRVTGMSVEDIELLREVETE